MKSNNNRQSIKDKLTEVLILLEGRHFEEVSSLLLSIKPQDESLMQQKCRDLLKNVRNGYHQLVRECFFSDKAPGKYLDIIGNVMDCYHVQADKDSEEYAENLANQLRYVGLCFESQKQWSEAATIYDILWGYCTERDLLFLRIRVVNDLAICKINLEDGVGAFSLYRKLEDYFDECHDFEAGKIDVLFGLTYGLCSYGVIARRVMNHWDTYRLFLKAYCAISTILKEQSNDEYEHEADQIIACLQYYDQILKTNMVKWVMETVIAHQECSEDFLFRHCGMFADPLRYCIDQMLNIKIIALKEDGSYEVLTNNKWMADFYKFPPHIYELIYQKDKRKILLDKLSVQVLALIRERKVEDAFLLLEDIKPQVKRLTKEVEDPLLLHLNNRYWSVAKNYFYAKDFEKSRMIYEEISHYYYAYAKEGARNKDPMCSYSYAYVQDGPRRCLYTYVFVMRHIELIFKIQKRWKEADEIHQALWNYCKAKGATHVYAQFINGVFSELMQLLPVWGNIPILDEIQDIMELLEVEILFDSYFHKEVNGAGHLNLVKDMDAIIEVIPALVNYGYALARFTTSYWKAYKSLIKAYCVTKDLIEFLKKNSRHYVRFSKLLYEFIPDNISHIRLCKELEKAELFLQYLGDTVLGTTPAIWGMENVVRHQKCSGEFLWQQCGLFGELQRHCVEQMILLKVIAIKEDGEYEVLVKDEKELWDIVGIKAE